MEKIKAALKLAADRMSLVDAFDRRAYVAIQDALAELEQSTAVEPAQAVPVAWLRPDKCHVDFHKHPGYLPLYTAPLAIDDETRSMVLELCESIIDAEDLEVAADDVIDFNLPRKIKERLEAGE